MDSSGVAASQAGWMFSEVGGECELNRNTCSRRDLIQSNAFILQLPPPPPRRRPPGVGVLG